MDDLGRSRRVCRGDIDLRKAPMDLRTSIHDARTGHGPETAEAAEIKSFDRYLLEPAGLGEIPALPGEGG